MVFGWMEREDYPRTLAELEARFSGEASCREYLFQLRWPDGFRCPGCGRDRAWPLSSWRWQCAGCGHQASTTAGTVFQDTRTPLPVWVRAMWWMTSQKNGVSALGLQQVLGWGSCQTAWTCLHKLRRARIRPGRERLLGVVEVDESYLGGLTVGHAMRQGLGGQIMICELLRMSLTRLLRRRNCHRVRQPYFGRIGWGNRLPQSEFG